MKILAPRGRKKMEHSSDTIAKFVESIGLISSQDQESQVSM